MLVIDDFKLLNVETIHCKIFFHKACCLAADQVTLHRTLELVRYGICDMELQYGLEVRHFPYRYFDMMSNDKSIFRYRLFVIFNHSVSI